MKTLHLSIITIVGIIIIVTTSVGIFMEKIGDNQQSPYANITINGVKENYTLNEPFHYALTIDGYGIGCGYTKEILKKDDYSKSTAEWGGGAGNFSGAICASNGKLSNFKFSGGSGYLGALDQTGNYTFTASFVDLINHTSIVEKRFSVILPKNTPIFDTGINPMSVNVTNTNFSVNYTLTSNNKLVDAKWDDKSKSLVLSLITKSNGTLIATIPRGLLDIVNNTRGEGGFYMMADGQETQFTQVRATVVDRTFSIPFLNGTSTIEIISYELI